MVTEKRAVRLVEALLSKERQEALRTYGTWPELVVLDVTEHALGWLVWWQSADYVRTGDLGRMLIGHGPYLVDREDGSIHHISVSTMGQDWETLYRWQVKGVRPPEPPDPLPDTVRALLATEGTVAALRHVRRQVPILTPQQAKAYVSTVRDGGDPPPDLTELIRGPRADAPPPGIELRAGPSW